MDTCMQCGTNFTPDSDPGCRVYERMEGAGMVVENTICWPCFEGLVLENVAGGLNEAEQRCKRRYEGGE